MMTAKGINTMRSIIKKRWTQVEFLFDAHIHQLRGQLLDLNIELPPIKLLPFQFFLQWEAGNIDAAEVYYRMSQMDFDDVYKNKILKPLSKLMVEHKDSMAIKCIETTIEAMNKDVKVPFIDFMIKSQRMFNKILDLEVNQPPVLFARFKHISAPEDTNKIRFAEVTPDQAMKLIKFCNFDASNAYVVNLHMIIFEQRVDDVKYINWFLADRKTIATMKELLKIRFSKFHQTQGEWFLSVARQLGANV